MRVFDFSMFFNEVDLLRIRYECLKDIVDFIVVIESSQTFAGNIKDLCLPSITLEDDSLNSSAKVIKISRTEFYRDYDDLVSQLNSNSISDFTSAECQDLLSHVLEFPVEVQNSPALYLDRFQRECCRVYINRLASDDDLIIFSDADELPDSIDSLCEQYLSAEENVYSLNQHQFIYFPNLYEKTWFGSIVGTKDVLLSQSLDYYRKKIGDIRCNTGFLSGFHGYHLTSMGGLEMIKQKIMNWGHQEYNNSYIIANLENNIRTGSDIFMRSHGSISKIVPLNMYYSSRYIRAINSSCLELVNSVRHKPSNPLKHLITRSFLKLCRLLRLK